MLYTVVLTFEFVDEILWYDHSNETTEQYFPVVPLITLYKLVQRNATEQNYPVERIFRCTRWFTLTFESLDKILWHSNESLKAVLSHSAVY